MLEKRKRSRKSCPPCGLVLRLILPFAAVLWLRSATILRCLENLPVGAKKEFKIILYPFIPE